MFVLLNRATTLPRTEAATFVQGSHFGPEFISRSPLTIHIRPVIPAGLIDVNPGKTIIIGEPKS
ncbi:MAG: hypothetical protein JXR87_04185 [Candidatus Marinimicrobia bacterium]|nr:hypothetical protein [Candidatus Neomarinimicrobiota bacterium]